MKIVVNRCHGGFGLSEKAYEKLIEYGVPVRKYVEPKKNKKGEYIEVESNKGEVIFDNKLADKDSRVTFGRYWDTWTRGNRTHPLVIKVVEELGENANGYHAKLDVVEIPDDVDWDIDEYDGYESIHEKHRSW